MKEQDKKMVLPKLDDLFTSQEQRDNPVVDEVKEIELYKIGEFPDHPFRVIDDDIESLTGLYSKPGSKITLLAAIKVLKNYDFKIPILIMPYLDGVEISVDCMKTPTGNIILPRYKTNKRYSEIIFDSQIIENTNLIRNN